MAVITSRTSLNQGDSTAVSGAIFATGTGADIRIHTSASNNLPALAAGEFFEVRDHSNTQNNGLFKVVTVTTSTDDYECDKITSGTPVVAGAEAITTLGATGASSEKSVHFDVAGLGIYFLEQGNMDADGVEGQAQYSFAMQEWKDDDFLIANAPFPMLCIDADAGKYIIGQNAAGINSGWNFVDVSGESIRTRKLTRNMGWDEVNSSGVTTARYFCAVTLGTFEDTANDTAYYMFGTDLTTDNTVDFDFAGPVNESVQFFDLVGDLSGDTPAYGSTSTITRATGSFVTDGFVVGGQVTVSGSTSNDGTYVLTGVAALTLTVTGTPFTVEAWGTSEIAVDNDNAVSLRLRVRDADTNGKTFAQANLASAGKTILGNFIYSFPLANVTDLKITATDVGIDSDSNGTADVSPYSGMSITFHSSPQARTDLVGGSVNFGIIIEGNNGTAEQVFEFIQWSLRSTGGFGTGDIDADADTKIGRAVAGLAAFVGDTAHFGSPDAGTTFAENPDGGGTGVYVDNLNATSKNDVVVYDNLNDPKTFPETIAVTLDFNTVLIDDTTAEYDLFYDRTIRTPSSTLTDFVLTNSTSKITSAGTNLPTNSEIAVGAYVRISGLTGGDEPMNGVYQITVITSAGADWTVVRYDGAAIVDVTTTAVDLDQNCIDTPDAIIVDTNVVNTESGSTVTYTSPDTISDSANGFGSFASGDIIRIEGSTSNDGIYEVDTAAVGSLTTIEQTITTEGSSSASVITKIVSGLADADEVFSYDFDGNTQGGRTVSTDTYIRAKAIGSTGSQYVTSTVQTIESGTPLTVPLVAQTERNYA